MWPCVVSVAWQVSVACGVRANMWLLEAKVSRRGAASAAMWCVCGCVVCVGQCGEVCVALL